jgi:hypothetical protein
MTLAFLSIPHKKIVERDRDRGIMIEEKGAIWKMINNKSATELQRR